MTTSWSFLDNPAAVGCDWLLYSKNISSMHLLLWCISAIYLWSCLEDNVIIKAVLNYPFSTLLFMVKNDNILPPLLPTRNWTFWRRNFIIFAASWPLITTFLLPPKLERKKNTLVWIYLQKLKSENPLFKFAFNKLEMVVVALITELIKHRHTTSFITKYYCFCPIQAL